MGRLLRDRQVLINRLARRWQGINAGMAEEYRDVLLLLKIEEQLIFLAAGGEEAAAAVEKPEA